MPNKFLISRRLLSKVFWEAVLGFDEERSIEKSNLFERLNALERLREKSDYNTSSINFSAAWCLYAVIRYFGLKRIAEVGTFIGKSSVAMLSAMDDQRVIGELFTCDVSNSIQVP